MPSQCDGYYEAPDIIQLAQKMKNEMQHLETENKHLIEIIEGLKAENDALKKALRALK